MVIWEIENHGTKTRACFTAISVEQIHQVAISKGYHCMVKYELYAGIDEKGHEISLMSADLETVDMIKTIRR